MFSFRISKLMKLNNILCLLIISIILIYCGSGNTTKNDFKIVILPINNDKKLSEKIIDHFKKVVMNDSLSIEILCIENYITSDNKNDIGEIMKSLNADLIVFGDSKNECSKLKNDVTCFKYKLSEKWKNVGFQTHSVNNAFEFGNIKNVEFGEMIGTIDFIVYWIAGISELNLNHIQKANKLFLQIKDLSKEQNCSLLNMLGYLNQYYFADYEKSMLYFTEAISTSQSQNDWYSLTLSYNSLANLYRVLNNFEKALEFQQKSIDILNDKCRDKKQELGIAINNIGLINEALGKYKIALENFEKSIEIKQSIPNNEVSVAISYNNIAEVYMAEGNYQKSIEYHEKSIALKQRVLNKENISMGISYNNLAGVYKNAGDHQNAVKYQTMSVEIYEKNFPNHLNLDLATSYINYADIQIDNGDINRAIEYYKKALEIRNKMLPSNHPLIPETYDKIVMPYLYLKQHKEALEVAEKSLSIRQKYLSADNVRIATSLGNVASVNSHMFKDKEALEYYNKALLILQKSLPPDDLDIATTYDNMAGCYVSLQEFDKALEFHNKGLSIYEKKLPPNHPELGIIYWNIAVTNYQKGDYKKAKEFIEKSVKILKSSVPENHPDLQGALQWQDQINNALKNK